MSRDLLNFEQEIQDERDRRFLDDINLNKLPPRFIKRGKEFGLTYPEMKDVTKEELTTGYV